ncbi:hypothetical protein SAMN06893096_105181 [Geodermatophilus pulveris]|uniref:Peptidoglycan lipid II flippase n=1 Tax=Geodermatophilus pulveris TaxID=1564159 RepID=A0A239FNC6_9ACTN|nr:hypothetical protein [Geodermatophilus pulveris]SNS58389.1 hypothetical protein SAMN06893096_105181 [Geodermatophilus pulveris]
MTSTTTGLPDRYRPIDQVGPAETTPTGVIRTWRAKDRILNRDVAIRVHTPGGPAAREWITRALTAGGLATPALAMVYDAAEGGAGRAGEDAAPGSAAYVVNEWIEGRTLAERLAEGPMPEREARGVLRRLAEGVAAAHRVGLAVGGLTPETVVLRRGGLVGLRSVPAATGTVRGDVAALGELLEYCLTGHRPGTVPAGPTAAGMPPDLAALVRRARSTDPGAGLSSVDAMAALLVERPRTGHSADPARAADESDSGWLRRLRERREEERAEPGGRVPAVDPAPTRDASGGSAPPLAARGLPPVPPRRHAADDEDDLLPLSAGADGPDGGDGDRPAPADARRRRLLLVGLPLLALAVVVALAAWLGSSVLSVTDDVAGEPAAVPSAPSSGAPAPQETAPPAAATIVGGSVYNPQGDGDPENPDEVPLSFDGDPSTAWSTVTYRGSPAFGNLKDGVGVLYDLGAGQPLAGVAVSGSAGATVEVRVGDRPDGGLDAYRVVAAGTLGEATDLSFDEPVTTRYVLVWVTGLAPSEGGFSAEVAEVSPTPAG